MFRSNCSRICPKCEFFNLSDAYFSGQFNLEEQNKFDPLANDGSCDSNTCETGTNKNGSDPINTGKVTVFIMKTCP